MKRILFSLICLTACFFLHIEEAKATHYAGGDITYEYVGNITGNTDDYYIILTLYRRELGIGFGPTASISIESACGNMSISLPQLSGGDYPPGFANCVDTTDPAFSEGAIEVFTYADTIRLNGPCDYKIKFRGCDRNGTQITNLNWTGTGTPCLYLESTLNNTDGPNTSPFFQNPAAKFFCIGQPFTWSQFATEPDGDSIRFTLGEPMDDDGVIIPWATGFSTNQPMSTANGFNFNPQNGTMQFTPTQQEVVVIKFVVEEYRFDSSLGSWRLVGTAVRELQVPISPSCSQVLSEGVKITQGVTTGNVTSTTDTFHRDSLISFFETDTIVNDGPTPDSVNIDVIGYRCFDTIISINVDGDLLCSSVSTDGTDFRLMGPDGDTRPVVAATTNCQTTLLTDSINLILHKPLDVNGDYLLQVRYGDDGSTIENECGFGVENYYSLIVRVQNCPELEYNMENVTVERDEHIRIDWYAVDSTYNRDFFNFWKIWRIKNGDREINIAEVPDPDARSYVDSSVSPGELDNDVFTYGVQLIQNQNHYREWTDKLISSILLTDSMYPDSSGFALQWTEYNGWDSPMYEVFIGTHDTVADVMNWLSYDGIDSNFYDSEYLFPDPMTPDTLGTYYAKVEAYDSVNYSGYVSESNWIVFELHDPEVEEEDDPDSELVIPNVFTPNGDYQNSTFAIQPGPYGGRDDEIHIAIYNRWGKQVHEFTKPSGTAYNHQHGWDGQDMSTGSVVSDGVYYYVIRLRDNDRDQVKEVKGHLTIVGGTN